MTITAEFLHSLVQATPGLCGAYRLHGDEVYAIEIAPQLRALLGQITAQVGMHGVTGQIHPDDRAQFIAGLHSCKKAGDEIDLTCRLLLPGHNPLWLHGRARLLGALAGETVFFAVMQTADDKGAHQQAILRMEKSLVMLRAALIASRQLCFEYDPVRHTADGLVDVNIFDLPSHVENYPECLLQAGVFHPEDMVQVRKTLAAVDAGAEQAGCEVRIKNKDKYIWYECTFRTYFDVERGYPVAICTIVDISLQKEALRAYRNHLDTVMRLNPDSIFTCRMNLTRNICSSISGTYENILCLQRSGTVDGFFRDADAFLPDEAGRAQFHARFTRAALLSAFENGRTKVALEHRYLLEKDRTEWLATTVDLVRNPDSGDVEAITYTKMVTTAKIAGLMLHEALGRDYVKTAVAYARRDEYYLFDNAHNLYGAHRNDFWNEEIFNLRELTDAAEQERLRPLLQRSRVLQELEDIREYSVIFAGHGGAAARVRYRISFSYISPGEGLMLYSVRNITDSVLLDSLRYEARHDKLTGLFNRNAVFARSRELLNAHPEERFVMLHFDIRRFHLFNAFFGEEEGDRLLYGLAGMMRVLALDYPCAAFGRIEADVFCMCMPYRPEIIARQTAFVTKEIQIYKENFLLEPSVGIYLLEDRTMPVEAMFSRATIAARAHLAQPGQYVVWFDAEMERTLQLEQSINGEMQAALDHEEFEVYIQPKYTLATGKPCGGEALVRWNHPRRGLVQPGGFIPVFEKNGFITKLDQYMWEHVCILLRRWLDAGLAPEPISVNVSRVSMYSPETVDCLKRLVEKYRLPVELLQLELTESAYMDDPAEMKNRLLQLQAYGFKILMDDFGSGYSSLNTLRELPVDYLKIDLRFLAHGSEDARGRLVLLSVVRMAGGLALPVVVEGVETEEQRDYLAAAGCEYAQGFLFARPMPVDAYEAKIIKNL